MPDTGQAVRRPTLRDVAERAEVSTSTASLAFAADPRVAGPTRARVLAAADQLGYAGPDPRARSLRQGRSGVVGAVVGERLRYAFADPHAVAVLDGLAEEVGALGAGLLLLSGASESEEHRLAQVSRVPLDAVVMATCGGPADPAVELLLRRAVPVVGVEGPHAEGVHLVDIDNRGASAALARTLVALGHTAVAVVALPWRLDGRRGPLDAARQALPGYDDCRLRLLGARDAVTVSAVWECAGNQVEEGERAAQELLTGPDGRLLPVGARPTAVLAQSDLLAVGVVLAARRLGLRVPEDLSVAGFDGVETPWLGAQALTTVVQPATEKGRAAGRMVAALLRGESPPDVLLPVQVRPGATTAPPPA